MAEEVKQVPVTAKEIQPLSTIVEYCQAIEAILYAAGHPMRYDKLAEVLGLSVKDVKNLTSDMAVGYTGPDCNHGIQLLLYPDSCQLCTKETYGLYVREALGVRRGGNLSATSMEVLAVIAYNQPTTRSFIDQVRGIDSSYHVNSLLDKGLIEASGRLDAPGRPMLYVTTDKFLRVFGLNSLDELPKTEALSVAAAEADEKEKNENMQLTLDVSAESFESVNPPAEYKEATDTEDENVITQETVFEFEDGTESLEDGADTQSFDAENV